MPTPSKLHPALNRRLQDARTDACLTQSEVARRLGIQRASVSQWEKGTTQPTMENLYEFARHTRKPLSWFLIEDDGDAMRAAEAVMPDDVLNLYASLPPALQKTVERFIRRAKAFSETTGIIDRVVLQADDDEVLDEIEQLVSRATI